MQCIHCQGLMVNVHRTDFGGFGDMRAKGWFCLNCGDVYDSVIARNRLVKQEPLATCEPVETEEEPYLGGEAFIYLAA